MTVPASPGGGSGTWTDDSITGSIRLKSDLGTLTDNDSIKVASLSLIAKGMDHYVSSDTSRLYVQLNGLDRILAYPIIPAFLAYPKVVTIRLNASVLSGFVTYKGSNVFVPGAAIEISTDIEDYQVSSLTADNGRWLVPVLRVYSQNKYLIKPGKLGDDRNGITALDAAYVMAYIVNNTFFTYPLQYTLADVSGEGSINVLDVVSLLLYSIRGVSGDLAGHWVFTPDSLVDSTYVVGTEITGRNFVGYMIGDVTGNYNGAVYYFPPATLAGANDIDKDVAVSSATRVENDTLIVDLFINQYLGAAVALEMELNLLDDAADFIDLYQDVDRTGFLSSYDKEGHLLKLVAVSGRGVDSGKPFVSLRFALKNDFKSLADVFQVTRCMLNDTEIPASVFSQNVHGSQGSVLPKAYSLSQNVPNPFNPSTVIGYGIPEGEAEVLVSLKVYNLRGQIVRTLVQERREAGEYRVEWDGRDGSGQRVTSGVYFYRLQAGAFTQTRKMVILK